VWCRILHLVVTYFTLSTYLWMLCEGTYLQILLVNTFQVSKVIVRSLLFLGWVVPLLVLIPYANYKQMFENKNCWMDYAGPSRWFLGLPVVIVITINTLFLFNVIRILRGKIEANNIRAPTAFRSRSNSTANITSVLHQAKAALILIPILGLHFILLPIRPPRGTQLEYIYEVLSCLSSSFQGLFVSLLLCFYNSEVTNLIYIRWAQFKVKHGFTVSMGVHLVHQGMNENAALALNRENIINNRLTEDPVEQILHGFHNFNGQQNTVI